MSENTQFTLWMERGFSRREIASRMQSAVPDLRIISTPIQPVEGTETIAYPSLENHGAGIDAFNEQIRAHDINALWPQLSATENLDGIEADIHVAGSPETINLVDDKAKFVEWLGDDPYRADTTEVLGAEAVAKEYTRRRALGKQACIKPVIGVYSNGYWRLNEEPGVSMLNTPEERNIHPDVYLAALEKEESNREPERLIMMDYLPGPEISVDLLSWQGEPLTAAARVKVGHGAQRIQSEHEVLHHSRDIVKKLGMFGIISLQYRLDTEGKWKILEINPRPAGGSTNSEDAGFGIISDWTRLIAGKTGPEDVKQFEGDVVVQVGRAVAIKNNGATTVKSIDIL